MDELDTIFELYWIYTELTGAIYDTIVLLELLYSIILIIIVDVCIIVSLGSD